MKQLIKWGVRGFLDAVVSIMGKSKAGRYSYEQILHSAMNQTMTASYGGVTFKFTTPNALNEYRAESFSTKEPETLEWIDRIEQGSVLWDIGANVGLYSCYAARKRGCRVYSFEPSIFNLELLGRNIFLNGLVEQITIIPLPLSEGMGVNRLNMTTTEWGGALSTFGQSYGHDGKRMDKVFEFSTMGVSMADAVSSLHILPPDYIKMDVDGIEHLILKGGGAVLRQAKEVLVEINDQFHEQARESDRLLLQAGFILKEKRHAEVFDTGMAQFTFNQIWARADAQK